MRREGEDGWFCFTFKRDKSLSSSRRLTCVSYQVTSHFQRLHSAGDHPQKGTTQSLMKRDMGECRNLSEFFDQKPFHVHHESSFAMTLVF